MVTLSSFWLGLAVGLVVGGLAPRALLWFHLWQRRRALARRLAALRGTTVYPIDRKRGA